MAAIDAELALRLPGRPQVRREILNLSEPDRRFVLRPDGSPAGVELVTAAGGFHALLSGPERADLEVHWAVRSDEASIIQAWALARGTDAESNVWDAFGRLVIPDLLARGTDAPGICLPAGHYTLTASVNGRCSMVIGVGVDADAVRERLRNAG